MNGGTAVGVFERGREEMSFHVMHADHRHAARERERLAERHAHEQRADESGRIRHRDGVDVGRTRIGERLLDHRHDRREVRARRDLRHDAAEHAMHVLRQDDERANAHVVAAPVPSRTAADVSSHDVSMPRTRITCAAPEGDGVGCVTRSTFTCDGFRRSVPSPVVSTSTRCGSESGKEMTARIVLHGSSLGRRAAAVPTPERSPDRSASRRGPAMPVVVTASAETIGTLRLAVDSKRSVTLRGWTSRTTASTPSGSVTSSGRRSTTTVSGEFGADRPANRRRIGRQLDQLLRRAGDDRVQLGQRIAQHERAVEHR